MSHEHTPHDEAHAGGHDEAHVHSTMDRLVYMANQIGTFFKSQGSRVAVPGIAEHIRDYWDPRMRASIQQHLEAGGAGLDPLVVEALQTLSATAPKSTAEAMG